MFGTANIGVSHDPVNHAFRLVGMYVFVPTNILIFGVVLVLRSSQNGMRPRNDPSDTDRSFITSRQKDHEGISKIL
jgi:hypothetical protein